MGKPILYGILASPPTRSVLLTAHAIGLDFEFKVVNPHKNEHKTEEFLKMNPQHTIPTLDDEGKFIWDSHAIITYLVRKYGKDDSLYPKDLFTRAIVDQRLHFDSGVFGARMFAYGNAQRTNDTEQIEKAKQNLMEAYDFLEKFLGDNQYFVGDSLTVADLSILGTLSTVNLPLFVPVDGEQYPKLAAWLERMTQLPYYEKANKEGLEQLVEVFRKMKEASEAAAS